MNSLRSGKQVLNVSISDERSELCLKKKLMYRYAMVWGKRVETQFPFPPLISYIQLLVFKHLLAKLAYLKEYDTGHACMQHKACIPYFVLYQTLLNYARLRFAR